MTQAERFAEALVGMFASPRVPKAPPAVRRLFNAKQYLRLNSEIDATIETAFQHYLRVGVDEGRVPPAGFTPETIASVVGGGALASNLKKRIAARAARFAHLSGSFDAEDYLARNSNLRLGGMDPFTHYVNRGYAAGRLPPPGFLRRLKTLAEAGDEAAREIYDKHLDALPKSALLMIEPDEQRIADGLGAEHPLPQGAQAVLGIVLFNNEVTEIRRLLNSIPRSRGVEGVKLVVVVINNGEPLEPDMVGLLDTYAVELLENPDGNIGSSKGHTRLMNHAFAKHGADAYVTLNPDGFFHPQALGRMLRMAARHEWRSAIEAAQLPIENSKYFDPDSFETEWAVTACALFTRRIWEKIGGFDPNIFLYCDDVDYGWRIRRAGFAVRYCPWAYYFHDFASRTAVSDFFRRNRLEAGRYLAHKWGRDDFREWCEDQLIESGHYAEVSDMPEIDHFDRLPAPLDAANFENEFYFARRRW